MTNSASAPWIVQPRAAWRICLGAGLVILVLTVMSSQQSLARACGGLAENYAPMLAFELARSEADLQLIFGPPGSSCHSQMIARMDSINWLDVLVFIPAYGTFLVGFFLAMRARNVTLASLGVKLSIAAIVTDYLENLCLMLLTPQLDATSAWMTLLPWATGAKWLALGAAAAVAGFVYIGIQPRKFLVVAAPAALICWISLVVTIAALLNPPAYGPVLSPAIGATWVIFLITAFTQALRPATATPP